MDIIGGQLTQTSGNPAFPGAVSTGPLIAGNVVHSDGSGTLAGVGNQTGTANQGYVEMVQFSPITQAGSTSALATAIVIPAQSMILDIRCFVTTVWSSTTTMSVSDTAGNSYITSGSGAAIGNIVFSPPATKSVIQQWENVGNTDVNITVTSGSTGTGLGILYVRYVQGCNAALST
jgi:hypothetical protein